MQIETEGILINMKPFSERDVIAHIFTKDNGLLVGMLKGAGTTKKNKPLIGQFGNVSWNARLDSQLGVFHWESEKNLSANLMFNNDMLKIMNATFSLIYTLVPERESYESLYDATLQLLKDLPSVSDIFELYLQWEIIFLRELGYAIDLTKCSNCKKTTDLCYLSPRTWRAVCAECGEPYRDKLYKLPLSLDTTKSLVNNICNVQGVDMPNPRKIF